MAIELAYPHVDKRAGEPARLQRMPRIRVAQIAMDHLAHGWSAEEIARQHPYLSLGEVHAALGYYFDHPAEIDAEIAAEWQEVRQNSSASESPFFLRMRAKGIL
jgi:uncharacterized protein (DUF433 family)